MFHGVCHVFRPYKAACTCLYTYTRSRKACRPVARAPLVREFSNVAAILRLDWARPPPFYTRTRDPFPRRCALRELRNSRVLNSRAARLKPHTHRNSPMWQNKHSLTTAEGVATYALRNETQDLAVCASARVKRGSSYFMTGCPRIIIIRARLAG